jgi:hypothetical protein
MILANISMELNAWIYASEALSRMIFAI